MPRRGGYEKLAPESWGPDVCPIHRLLNYTEIMAKIDAQKIREQAADNSPRSMAHVARCDHSPHWHIFIPTKGRARTLRKRNRGNFA